MSQLPEKLQKKIENRIADNALRVLDNFSGLVDFSSNDYLGFSASETIFNNALSILKENNPQQNGATGSRLLSGNYKLYEETESFIAGIHKCETALIFNSGYAANSGFFASVPQRGDVIFYDELVHASIRDGILMSNAKAYKFRHNDMENLKIVVERSQSTEEVYIITESVFSMDGDTPDIRSLANYCSENNYHLVIDEAHALGVVGKGKGIVQELNLEDKVFARIATFGKALGCHGAVILGSNGLKRYLINFCRSFIYTTALPPHAVATIKAAYEKLTIQEDKTHTYNEVQKLNRNIAILRLYIEKYELKQIFVESVSAVHCCLIPGNDRVKSISEKIKKEGFDVKPILSPTVPKGQERLRLCIHSFNTEKEIKTIVGLLATFIK